MNISKTLAQDDGLYAAGIISGSVWLSQPKISSHALRGGLIIACNFTGGNYRYSLTKNFVGYGKMKPRSVNDGHRLAFHD